MQVVICYDVSEDPRRARLAKAIGRHLDRVQKSTFEGEISAADLERLTRDAHAIIDTNRDTIRIYYLCQTCRGRTGIIGTGNYVIADDGDIIL